MMKKYPVKSGGDNWEARGHIIPKQDLLNYVENKSTLNWPHEFGVYMNTKFISEWRDMVRKAGFKNIQTWQVGAKDDWTGTLIIYGEK